MITVSVPGKWRDLQNAVGRILTECGFEVEVEKVVQSVRGRVEVDVFADEYIQGRRNRILCECKHWRQRVPQTVVHGFRTVVQDVGANTGYIVSIRGFQKGAYVAAENTNIELLDWEGFQTALEPSWLINHLVPRLTREFDHLISCTGPLGADWMRDVPDHENAHLRELRGRWAPLSMAVMQFTSYVRVLGQPVPALPITDWNPPGRTGIPTDVLAAKTYREFEEACVAHARVAMAEFDAIRNRYGLEMD